jgi:hypothetical protein
VQDRQHRAVAARVEELVRVPARRERPGLGLAVADDAGDDELGVVEGGAEGVHQRVAELAALVDRAGHLRRRVAQDPAREGELAEELPQPVLAGADLGVALRPRPLEVRVGDDGGAAVAGAGDVERLEVARADRAVQVRPDQVQPGDGAEVAEQPRLHVVGPERLAQQRVREQVDLPHGEVVGGAPPRVEQPQLLAGERLGGPGRHGRSRAKITSTLRPS